MSSELKMGSRYSQVLVSGKDGWEIVLEWRVLVGKTTIIDCKWMKNPNF